MEWSFAIYRLGQLHTLVCITASCGMTLAAKIKSGPSLKCIRILFLIISLQSLGTGLPPY